jgi:transcriptional regulator with XRE-family HTH domain
LRLSHTLTQLDVGESVGVSKAAVSQWELDVAVPQGENLIRLAERFGTTPGELLWGGNPTLSVPLNEMRLSMAISCLEIELGDRYSRLPPPQKAKLVGYLYNRGEPLSKQELVALLGLVG